MKHSFVMTFLLIGGLFASGCATVTVRDKGTMHISREANYDSSESFFLWGLAGTKHINTREICGAAPVQQLQTQRTFLDGFLAALTLGIYSPRTARVWCAKGDRS